MGSRLRTTLVLSLALGLWACGGGGGGGDSTSGAGGDFAPFPVFEDADVVFGQPVFVLNDPNQGAPLPNAGTLKCPGMPAVGPLFVPDAENHRVLGFAQAPIISNLEANFVLGQPDFHFAAPGLGATAMNAPTAACVAGGRLLVADAGNHRVLIYSGVPSSKGAAAEAALGQADLVSATPGAGASGLNDPSGIAVGGGRLVIADRANHRVLIWNSVPSVSGTPADLVLGQADFDGVFLNRGGSVGPGTLFDPCGVWTDGQRLAVADRGNHRVLIWNRFPTSHGQPADVALGQPDPATRVPGAGQVGLLLPSDVDSNGAQLCVADAGNHRVLVWYRFPDTSGAPAEGVIGQSDFDHRAPNDEDQDGQEDPVSSARTLKSKNGVLTVRIDGPTLFIGDTGNHRLLVFRGR